MTIVVDDEKKGGGTQNPGISPQHQDNRRKLLIIGDIIAITGSLLFLTSGVIRLFLDTTFRP